ncbi:host-nuclease inhibitor Gam family protein [Mucilaginibacter rubeus]|nr:host-nuclease inhibitor Gam family protein [Mucilaginibacter rubeus]
MKSTDNYFNKQPKTMAKNTNRAKADAAKIITKQECTEAFSVYAAADAEQSQINAELEIEINKLRDAKAKRMLELQAIKNGSFAIMKAYAMANKSEFAVKRSMIFSFGKIGFRTGTPAITLLKGFKMEAVIALVKKHLPDYIRTVEVIAKDELIAKRSDIKVNDHFAKCGFKVTKSESFFVEPKKEDKDANSEEVEAAA